MALPLSSEAFYVLWKKKCNVLHQLLPVVVKMPGNL